MLSLAACQETSPPANDPQSSSPFLPADGNPAVPVGGSQVVRLQYQCNIGGQPGTLISDVEGIQTGGRAVGIPIMTGEIITYAGTLVTQSARYSFIGENEYAEFTDLINGSRFRVQFLMNGNTLQLTANPFGPQPAVYMCQLTG